MNHKKNKFVIPLSNESIKKALLGASIIVGGFGLLGNTNDVYADSLDASSEIIDNNQIDEGAEDKSDEKEVQENLDEGKDSNIEEKIDEDQPEDKESDRENKEDIETEEAEDNLQVANISMLEVANFAEPVALADVASDEPNYSTDEKNVGSYKDTQLERGNGPAFSISNEPSMDFKDGFRYNTIEPGADSPDKTKWGIEMEFDKEKGQRTYTDFSFSNSGLMGGYLDSGTVPANKAGEKIGEGFKATNYEAGSVIEITSSRTQRNLNLYASVDDLAHINNKDINNIFMAWKGQYTKDNTSAPFATQGSSATFTFTVNPWPNENDQLDLIKLSGSHDKKEFVQGQTIDTGIKVENLDDNAKERLVGQVYHPVTGKVVPGAEAYIDDNGNVKIKMPEGALKLEGGKYVVNEDSIFAKDPDYKGLTHLDVRFFARPRTADEFRAIGKEANYGVDNYTSTGAGTEVINHNGQSVTIDKQGIARYDHYNLIGHFNLNLDDTRYYDQEFKDEEGNKIDPNDSTSVGPGKKATIRILDPSTTGGTQKTGAEMDAAYKDGQATGKLKEEYLIAANKKIARELGISYEELMKEENKDKRWVIDGKSDNISYFDITAPKNAKAGDTIALPVVYTYTNGSTDTRWFHFVVQESVLNKPEYEAQVDFPSEKQTSPVKITEDEKKLSPIKYSIKEDFDNKDDHGNEWTVSIDETTGQVTAQPKDSGKFNGGEKLKVPVIAHYEDPHTPDEDVIEETTAEFIIKEKANMTPRYNAKAGKAGDKLSSDIILNEEDKFNRRPTKFTINTNAYKDDKGNTWQVSIDESTGKVTATVPDGENIDGALLNVPVIAHYFEGGTEKGTRETEVQFIASGTKNTIVHEQEIPFEIKVEVVDDLAKGEWRYKKVDGVELKGKPGSKKTTYTIKDSKIVDTKEDTIDPEDAVIEVGSKDFVDEFKHVEEIPFKYQVKEVDTLKKGEYEIVKPGKVGTKTTTWKIVNSKVEGEPTITTVEAEDAIINVGKGTNSGTHEVTEKVEVPFETIIEFDDSLKPGEQKVTQEGELGQKTRTNTLTIEDGKVTNTDEGEYSQTKAPVNRIIKVGRNTEGTHTYEEKIPFKYTISYDENLKSGEYVIDVEGKEGTRTTTWTIKNSEIVGDPKVETTDPVNAVIRVGKKDYTGEFSHEVTEKIPFTVRIIEDETLEAGKSEVVTQGQAGSKTTKYTQAIKNGEADGELKSEVTKKTEPVEHVIRVGKKPATNSVTKESTVPVDIVYKYDPNLDVTVAKQGKFTPGEVKTVVTNEYNPETGKIESKEETVVKNATQEIIVGTKKYTGEFKNVIEEEIPYETEVIFDDELKTGTMVVDQAGKPGSIKKEFIQHFENGEQKSTEEKELERTEPEKRIVRVGSKTEGTHQHKEEIPFGYKVVYDPDMEAGKYEEVTPGRVGERITTWTIKNSKIVGAPTVAETKPVDAVIKVGSKDFTGTFETKKTDFIEFETEYIVDNTMEPGTTEVIQEGEHGEIETTVTHTIKNGEVTESKDGEPRTVKAAKNRKVKVGAAKSNGTYEYTNKVPYDVEVRVNPKLKKGEYKVIKKGEPGEEKYTLTIENSKVTNTSESSIIKTPVKEIIEVGNADFTGTVEYVDKDPIPFETEVTVDPSLKPGEIVEDQKGELGEQETKITRTITNGQAGEENRGETTRTKEPVNRKIRVGSQTDGQYKETETIPFEVEVRKDPTLKKGEWKYAEVDGVQQTGESGLKERTLTIVNSEVAEESEFKTTREPKNAVILVGDDSTEGEVKHTEEIPFGYKVEESDELKPGEYKIVKPGKVGTITTTWTIKDSKVVGDPKVERVEAEDALIQVGKGTNDGTHDIVEKKELPFETRYEYDDSLEPGEEKVVSEGSPGEAERTNTIVIKDGKVVEVKEGEFKTTKEPQERLIKIGRKPSEGETTKTIEREIPYETKVIYDDTLEAGFQKIEKEGKPGKEEVTITQKIKDSKPVGEATETTKTITEKEDRVVRIGVKPVVKETELGHDTEYRHNPELKAGEEKVTEEGSKGSVKYTTTFNKETGKLEVTEERTEPKNKVVEYGSKTDGEFTYESEKAYNVIIRENPELEAGKHNVVQEGIVGKTETTVKIENSKEVSRDTKTITEKQDMIIEIGTKNVCEIPPVNPEPGKPGDKEEPSKPGDKEEPCKPGDKEEPGKPGEEKPNEPGTPGETPQQPGKPGKPNEPGEKPDQPSKPEDPKPEKPQSPDKTETPDKSEKPKNKDQGVRIDFVPKKSEKAKEAQKDNKSNRAPKTGVSGTSGVLVSLIGAASALFVTKKKKKK